MYVEFPPERSRGADPQFRRDLLHGREACRAPSRNSGLASIDLCHARCDNGVHRWRRMGGAASPRRVDSGGLPLPGRNERRGCTAPALYSTPAGGGPERMLASERDSALARADRTDQPDRRPRRGHCGAKAVQRAHLRRIRAPRNSPRWRRRTRAARRPPPRCCADREPAGGRSSGYFARKLR